MFGYELLQFSQKKEWTDLHSHQQLGPISPHSQRHWMSPTYFLSVKTVLGCQETLKKYITPKSHWFNTNRILSITKIFSSNPVTKPFGTNVLEDCYRRRRETIFKCLDPTVTLYFLLPSIGPHHLSHLIAKGLRNNSFMC